MTIVHALFCNRLQHFTNADKWARRLGVAGKSQTVALTALKPKTARLNQLRLAPANRWLSMSSKLRECQDFVDDLCLPPNRATLGRTLSSRGTQ